MIKLSFSKISTYIECPRKYFLSYICNMGTGSSPHMSNGSAIHKCCEDFESFTSDLESDILKQKFTEIFETPSHTVENMILYYYKILPEIDKNNLVHEDIDGLIIVNPLFEQKAIKAFKSFYEDYIENFYEQDRIETTPRIIATEQWFNLKLSNGHEIRGLIDRIDEEEAGEHIMDYKSGQSRITFKALKDPLDIKSLQLSTYALSRYKETGKIPHKASFFYLEPDKNAKKQKGQYRSANGFTEETMVKVEQFLTDIAEEIDTAITERNFPMGISPNCFWCEFNRKCEILSESELIKLNNEMNLVKDTKIEIDTSLWDILD
jgi:ATP-dependent helicase/DNAse subunit B